MKDSAVSVVIGYMILLVITVSFISLLNAVWIPQMKQQAEVDHLGQVEQSFLSLATDIDRMTTFRQNSSINHRIQLGGGDVTFSPVRSSGSLRVNVTLEESAYLKVSDNHTIPVSYVGVSYQPIGNFWIDQKYIWDNGTVFLAKPSRKNLTAVDSDNTQTFVSQNLRPHMEGMSGSGNYTTISLSMVSLLYHNNESVSGNGYGTIKTEMVCPVENYQNVTAITGILPQYGENWLTDLYQDLNRSGVACTLPNGTINFNPDVDVVLKNCSLCMEVE